MAKYKLNKTKSIVFALLLPLLTSGCCPQSDCEKPSKHAHWFVGNTKFGIVSAWRFSESLKYGVGNWTPETIEITEDDLDTFTLLNGTFNGVENWNYLFNFMRSKRDYFEFYYEYDIYVDYTTTDSNGKKVTKKKKERITGWHKDPYSSNNTGYTRLIHHRFCGYAISVEDLPNGEKETSLRKSEPVDDIRSIIYDYPYYYKDPSEQVPVYFHFRRRDLPFLNVEDYRSLFNHPDLSTSKLEPAPEVKLILAPKNE